MFMFRISSKDSEESAQDIEKVDSSFLKCITVYDKDKVKAGAGIRTQVLGSTVPRDTSTTPRLSMILNSNTITISYLFKDVEEDR